VTVVAAVKVDGGVHAVSVVIADGSDEAGLHVAAEAGEQRLAT
jgi:hypothetical protein